MKNVSSKEQNYKNYQNKAENKNNKNQISPKYSFDFVDISNKEFEIALQDLKESFKDPEIRGVYERLRDK